MTDKKIVLFLLLAIVFPHQKKIQPLDITGPASAAGSGVSFHPEVPLESQINLAPYLGFFERTGSIAGFDFLRSGYGIWGSIFFPSEIGVFGFNALYVQPINNNPLMAVVRTGFGKKLTPDFYFGFYLSMKYSDPGSFTGGLEPSLIFLHENEFSSPVNFHNFFLYSGIRNLDIPFKNTGSIISPEIFLGTGTKFLSIKGISATLQFQAAISTLFDRIPLSSEIVFQYLPIQLRAGYLYNFGINRHPDGRPDLSAGIGFEKIFPDLTLSLQYGINGFLTGNYEHHISIGALFSTADKTPPKLEVTTSSAVFSPNDDGHLDNIIFSLKVRDQSSISDWQLIIKNNKNEIVREFKKDRRKRSIYFPPYRTFTELFKRNEYRYVPEKILWDGRGNNIKTIISPAPESASISLPEGVYFYSMTVTDAQGLISNTAEGTLTIDNTAPELSLFRSPAKESLSNGVFFSCTQNLKLSEDETAVGTIKNLENETIRQWKWDFRNPPPVSMSWDGKNEKGLPSEKGIYSYGLEVMDPAGNTRHHNIEPIIIPGDNKKILVTADRLSFSPSADRPNEILKFLVQGDAREVKQWKAFITKYIPGKSGRVNPVYLWNGNGNPLPTEFIWKGTNLLGNIAAARKYFFTIEYITAEGQEERTVSLPILLDNKVPEITIFPNTDTFTPDEDGVNDTLVFSTYHSDQSEIIFYNLSIFEVNNLNGKKTRTLFRHWQADSPPPQSITFNGISDSGLLMESLHTYEYTLEVKDSLNNAATYGPFLFHTGVLVQPFENRLKITLTGDYSPEGISPYSFDNFRSVLNILLADYPAYRVRIEGHTSEAGPEEKNLVISEERAKNIFRFFVLNGFDPVRAGYQGYGEIVPLSDQKSELKDYKNNRIEFILLP